MSRREYLEFVREEELGRLKPLRDAEKVFQETTTKLARAERDRVIAAIENGEPDPGFRPDEAYDAFTLPNNEVSAWVEAQAASFVQENSDFFRSSVNQARMMDYLAANGVTLPSVESFKRAWKRLDSFGLLERAVEEPEPTPLIAPQAPPQQEKLMGLDLSTGRMREYTPWEVDRLTADEYKRIFKVRNMSLGRLTRIGGL